MVAYSGALQPKKKSELQEIAVALSVPTDGTKDELQARIKKHLDAHQDALEDDPVFAGLFGRRRRSVQPQPAPVPLPAALAGRFAPSASDSSPTPAPDTVDKPRSSRRAAAAASSLDSIKEYVTSAADDVPSSSAASTPAKKAASSLKAAVEHATEAIPLPLNLPGTPSASGVVAAAKEHAPESPVKKLIDAVANSRALAVGEEAKDAVVKRLKHTQQVQMQGGAELLVALRDFLSNSRNIWSLTSLIELLYILGVTVPWQTAEIPLGNAPASPSLTVVFPPLSALRAPALWTVLIHWALPTLILPALFGTLISFDPALKSLKPSASSSSSATSASPEEQAVQEERQADGTVALASSVPTPAPAVQVATPAPAQIAPLDPLTAAIARLFLASAYPYARVADYAGVAGLDVLGADWRTRSAALGLACAFAEAVGRAPGVALKLAGSSQVQTGDGKGNGEGNGNGKGEGQRLVTQGEVGGRGRRALEVHAMSPEVD